MEKNDGVELNTANRRRKQQPAEEPRISLVSLFSRKRADGFNCEGEAGKGCLETN